MLIKPECPRILWWVSRIRLVVRPLLAPDILPTGDEALQRRRIRSPFPIRITHRFLIPKSAGRIKGRALVSVRKLSEPAHEASFLQSFLSNVTSSAFGSAMLIPVTPASFMGPGKAGKVSESFTHAWEFKSQNDW